MKLNLKTIVASAILAASSASVFAHGPQIQITYDTTANKIVTRSILNTTYLGTTNPSYGISGEKRIYLIPFEVSTSTAGTFWYGRPIVPNTTDPYEDYRSDPGVAYQYENTLNPNAGTGWQNGNGANISTGDIKPDIWHTKFSVTFSGGLKKWDGSAFNVVAAATESLQTGRGGSITTPVGTAESTQFRNIDNSTGAETMNFFTDASTGIGSPGANNNAHSTATYRLVGGAGSPADPTDLTGLYLVGAQINTNALTDEASPRAVGSSDTFYFLFYKPTDAQLATAYIAATSFASSAGIDASAIQVVPEPTSLGLIGLGAIAALRRKRA